ncbi:uracil-DNA glycosylase family protein [Fictibacillus aquaticus]|uniref:Uracil-DNA glycosylase-like domain-containing protein n=1 Tax=Fictibacillus aquaticus TaxID=2021314 RepID=A0A235FBK6_9BACL|nr:uracil-DNA glycosylase family protein [Fictibacillus aquaticus]OYD58728.1 hypothetical protein CGZ90_02165 [Fictibacillus aquaticus]
MNDIRQSFTEAKNLFNVPDLAASPPCLLFVLESPHKEEIKHGVPVAGGSGKTMTKYLLQENVPFGIYLSKNPTLLKTFGIVNVCPFPMQSAAIPDEEWKDTNRLFLKTAESIRTSTALKFKDEKKAVLQDILLKDFKERLLQSAGEKTIIVPCGKFAERYTFLAGIAETHRVITGVPHPSYNSWAKERYQNTLSEMKEMII